MYKKFICRLLAIFLFVFISVTFLIPSDLVAEPRNFWVDEGHYEDQDFWVESGYFKDTWVNTSHNVLVTSGYFEVTQEKRWVDTSYMVYQGYRKDVTKSFWVDTRQWVSGGYWKDVTERVWVSSGYTAYRDVKFWIDTSHNKWVTSGYMTNIWVDTSHNKWVTSGYMTSIWMDTSHWENQAYSVWVSSGYTASRWVDTSHWETRSERVWVSSGYWGSRWVDTSHWEYKPYKVWVKSGYWQSYWVDTSHWETRSYNVWVSSGYTTYYWVDTSHYETRYRDVWVTSGYMTNIWVDTSHNKWVTSGYMTSIWMDTSHNVWVSSGYWTTVKESYWEDTSHWEDQKVWVPGHWETRYRYVENWQPSTLTIYTGDNSYQWAIYSLFAKYQGIYTITYNGNKYHAKKYVIETWSTQPISTDPNDMYGGWLYIEKYECYEVSNWVKESYSEWVPPDYKKEWVDTSHWEESGYWQSYTYRTWVDTSYMVESGYWEDYTNRTWVDTSHNEWVTSGYFNVTWVDTSHYEYKAVWVEDGFYTSPLHGEVIVEKSPRYIFTRWHKDQNNEECSMKLNVSWKVDNSNLSEGEEEKEIVRIYIYQDICRYDNKGVEKVIIFNGNVTPSVEGSINTITKFDYSGSEESILHIYLYAQNGESAHVYFNNPINGFRSINLMSEGSDSDASTWLGGYNYDKFEF